MTKIQILGTGCPKCKLLTAHAEAAVKALGIEATIEKVEKIQDIMKFAVGFKKYEHLQLADLGLEKGKTPPTPEVIAKAAKAGAAKLVC